MLWSSTRTGGYLLHATRWVSTSTFFRYDLFLLFSKINEIEQSKNSVWPIFGILGPGSQQIKGLKQIIFDRIAFFK
jgi:hypothetical protein